MNITKDGIEVKVGQRWRDLDKRMGQRVGVVTAIVDGKATIQMSKYHITRISIRRMHKCSTGWELVA